MMPTAVPQADFVPYLLRQTRFGPVSYKPALDSPQMIGMICGRIWPSIACDACPGLTRRRSWKGFVHGVVRNHACVLASRRPDARSRCALQRMGRPMPTLLKMFPDVTCTLWLLTISAQPGT